jgi:RNA polymerase sigma-70 factor, ECF subfamily
VDVAVPATPIPSDELAAQSERGTSPVVPAGGVLVNRPPSAASNREARKREAEEDRELIAKAQKGDRASFQLLVQRHQRRAFAIALGLCRDENDARDIVQEAFLRVYRGIDGFQHGSSFFTWLYRIVTNLTIDLMRKPGRKQVQLGDGHASDEELAGDFPLVSRIDGADPMDVMRRKEIAARIQAALEALPPYHRGVILMREVEGMSYEEMAEAMNVSKGTIMSRLFHARQKLQKALADCYAESTASGPRSDSLGRGKE